MVFATPLFWITSPWMRRMRITTMGDFYEERYASKKMAATYAIIGTIGMMGLLSVGYTAMNRTIMAITPKPVSELTVDQRMEYNQSQELASLESVNYSSLTNTEKERLEELRIIQPKSMFSYINGNMLIWIVCLVVLIYAVLGGLEAAFYTDLLQGFFIIILSLILIPFSWIKIKNLYGEGSGESAMSILHQKLPESFFEIFGSPTLIDFTWYFIIAAALVAGITVVTQPNQLVTNAAAKDEYSARFGFVTGGFMKRFSTIMWGLVGLAAVLLYTGQVQDSDLVWGYATRDLLGELKLGLVGLMVVSMMAALMSTASTLMLTVSGLLLNNAYRPLVKGKSQNHYVWASRLFGGLFLIGSALVATQFDNILEILKFIWEFFVIFAAAFWLGLKWRRANRAGAWASISVTLLGFYLLPLLVPVIFSGLRTNTALLLHTQPQPIERTYTARLMDVEERNAEIAAWESLSFAEQSTTEKPEPIVEGEKFAKKYTNPAKPVFWSKAPKVIPGQQLQERGYLFRESWLIHYCGADLSKTSYAFNETLRMLIRLIFPFIILIVVSLFTKPDQEEIIEQFFIKMRTRVRGLGHEVDAEDVAQAMQNPQGTTKVLLFPKSKLEMYKWGRQDIVGFLISIVIVFVVIGTLFVLINMGK